MTSPPCPACGAALAIDRATMLTSLPPKHSASCTCGWRGFVDAHPKAADPNIYPPRAPGCTCGSGAHPRHCALHPAAFQEHIDELNRENEAALHFATLAVEEHPALANGTVSASTVVMVNGVRYVVAVSREGPGALGLSGEAAPRGGMPPDAVKVASTPGEW